MARFFSSTLMGLTATAGAIGAPGPAPPINTLFVEVVMTRDSRRSLSSQARMREPQSDGTRKRGGRSLRGLPPVEACAPAGDGDG